MNEEGNRTTVSNYLVVWMFHARERVQNSHQQSNISHTGRVSTRNDRELKTKCHTVKVKSTGG